MNQVKVLFVCMGNICRSPTAHGIFQHLVREQGLAGEIAVDSAGTIGYHVGEAPDPRSTQTASKHGIDLTPQRARQVSHQDYIEQDYILAMDFDNLRNMQLQCPDDYKHKLKLLLDYHPDEFLDQVPDPYYGGESGFDRVYDMVEVACKALLEHIKSHDLKH
jgi:protein-tyrosine phosphatase